MYLIFLLFKNTQFFGLIQSSCFISLFRCTLATVGSVFDHLSPSDNRCIKLNNGLDTTNHSFFFEAQERKYEYIHVKP